MKYLFAIGLLLCTGSVYSQENFGAQFKNWVLTEAAKDSRALANADYQSRVSHTISTIDEQLIGYIRQADSAIQAIYLQIQQDEKALSGLDSLQAILQRARSARLAHYRLLEAENLLYFAARLKTNLDSLGSSTYFYSTGLYHVGRETLLESYATIGEQFAKNFQLKYRNDYTIGFSATFNAEGDVTSGGAEVGQPGMFTVTGTAIGAALGSMAGGIGAIPGGVIGGAIGGTIDYFLGSKKAKEAQEKAEKEFRKQMKLLEEGIKALPDQLAPVDTLLNYYQGYVKYFSAANAAVYRHADSTFQLEQQRFKEIFSYNVRRQQISQQQLTADRIAMIEKHFMSLESLRNFYSNLGAVSFTKDCKQMLGKLRAEESWLRTASVTRFDWLQRNEAYQDDLRFALVLVQQFMADETYLPYQQFLLQTKAELDSMARNPPAQPVATSLAANATSMKAVAKRASMEASKKSIEQLHLVMPQVFAAKAVASGSYEFGICFGAGGYRICDGMKDDSYGDRFNNRGRSPINDILGSSSDGGLRSFSVKATREINKMKESIKDRVGDLKEDYSKLSVVLPDARILYSAKIKQVAVSAGELGTISAGVIQQFEQDFDSQMPAVQASLRQFMNQPLRTGLSNLQQNLKLSQQIKNQIPVANIPVSSFRIGNMDFGYPSQAGKDPVAVAWDREGAKQLDALQAIDRRVKENKDPVFDNQRDFDAFKNKLGQINRLLANVNNNGHYSFEDQQRISSHYLGQAVRMRYAASGNLPASELEATDYPFLDREQLDRLNSLANTFKQCNPEEEDCASVYSHAIYEVYRNNSIAGLRNSEGQSFNAGNLQQLATASSEWEAVGSAGSAGAVNQAALLAMSGNLVIATRPDGMNTRVGIVLPELPKPGSEGTWNGMPVPDMFYIDEDNPERSFGRNSMSAAFPNPGEVTFYTSRRPTSFNNKAITVQDKGVTEFNYSNPISGEQGVVPALRFTVQTNTGTGAQISEQEIPLAGDYVGRIVQQYGNNSRQVFETLYANRDELYGPYTTAPAGLTPAESGKLQRLRQSAGRFEDKEKLLNKPEDLYYCQTSRVLYNSCINELNNVNPLDRGNILDYYNKIETALVKYHDDLLNAGTMLTPGINDARDLYEFITGKDLITGALLTIWERGLSGAGLLIGSGAFYRQIDNLPMVQQTALDIAQKGIPDFKMIQTGDLKYFFKSKEGIYYERWSSEIGRDRYSKIVQDHYLNMSKSRFKLDDPNAIPALLDEAWVKAKDLHLVPTTGHGNNIKYIVDMGRDIGQKKGERFIHLVFDGNREPGFIITAFPSRSGKYPILD